MSRKKKSMGALKNPVAQSSGASKLEQGIQKIYLSQMRWKYGSRIIIAISTVIIVILLLYGPQDRLDIVSKFIKNFSVNSTLSFFLIIGIIITLFNNGLAKIIASRDHDEDLEI